MKRYVKLCKVGYSFYQESQRIQFVAKKRGFVPYSNIRHFRKRLGQKILRSINLEFEVIGNVDPSRATLYVGNHISYVDIPLLNAIVPAVFLAKSEVKNYPIFGPAGNLSGIIYVERESKESRKKARQEIIRYLQQGQNVCVFPAGTTSLDEKVKEWRWGAFEIAKELEVPVAPFRFTYEPLRKVAYIDDDIMLPHIISLVGEEKIKATLEFAKPIKIQSPQEESRILQQWCQEMNIGSVLPETFQVI